MKTKSTLEKAVKFVTNCKIIFSQRKNIFQKGFFGLLCFLITSIAYSQSGSCKATFGVEKNRNYGNTTKNGARFTLVITNEGNSKEVYKLSATNVNGSCSNNDESSTSQNVNLNSSFLDKNSAKITSIEVPAHSTVRFSIHLTVPTGTPYNKWNCTQINAVSSNCTNYAVNTVVHTIVNNPSEN